MTVLTFPAAIPAPNSMTLGLAANTQSGGRSPLDGTEQTLELPGARWVAELRWQALEEAHWRALSAFVARLGGRAGRFTWSPIARFPRRGTATGTPLVNGGAQTGKSLATDGWGTGTAFLAGDLVGWLDPTGRSVMHQVVADATVSAGAATLTLAPAIRRSPADNAGLILAAPSPVWRLARDDVMADYEPGERGFTLALAIEEAVL
jgi:hypothetical protein